MDPQLNAPQPLADASRATETAMEKFMDGRTLPLYRMMGYHLGWVDENGERLEANRPLRLRGALCLLAAGASGATGAAQGGGAFEASNGHAAEAALQHAVAIELVHNYSQMHTDVQEGNTERGGRASVWWVWGPAQAINAGDGMHALARLALFGLRDRGASPDHVSIALRALDEATLRLCEGSYYDTVYQERLTVSVDEYLNMAEGVAGALVGCAVRLGAIASGETDSNRLDALQAFGTKVGTAMRLADDYAAFWPPEERDTAVQGRLLSKKKSLAVVHALQEADLKQKRRLGEFYAQRVLDPGDIEKIRSILDEAGSKAFSEETLNRLRAEADAALTGAGLPHDASQVLREAARFAGESSVASLS
jgi:geranylgeranyl diphosphate synthase type I